MYVCAFSAERVGVPLVQRELKPSREEKMPLQYSVVDPLGGSENSVSFITE